jgi:hypothetical protein
MIQSARSGKQNILEGSKAALTSKESEIKLTNVARASLEELLEDYYDYLRVRDLPLWEKDSKQAQFVRRLGRETPQTFELYREFFDNPPARSRRQHHGLPDPPDQLPARPTIAPVATKFAREHGEVVSNCGFDFTARPVGPGSHGI